MLLLYIYNHTWRKWALGFSYVIYYLTLHTFKWIGPPFNNKPGVLYRREGVSPPKLPMKMLSP